MELFSHKIEHANTLNIDLFLLHMSKIVKPIRSSIPMTWNKLSETAYSCRIFDNEKVAQNKLYEIISHDL